MEGPGRFRGSFYISIGFHEVSQRFYKAQQSCFQLALELKVLLNTWVVVKIMVPFWVPIIIRHLLFRVPKKGA